MAVIWTYVLALLGAEPGRENLSLDQVLAGHNATQKRLKRCAVTSQERWLVTRANGTQLLATRTCDVRLDGVRANLLVNEVSYPPGIVEPEPGQPGNVNEFNYVCTDQVLELYLPYGENGVRPKLPSAVIGRLSPESKDEFLVLNAMGNGAIAFGQTTFLTPIPIAKLISLSKNGPVTRDEMGCCVAGTAPDGTRHKIWFDPQFSFVIRGLTFEQSGEMLNDNRFRHNRQVLTAVYGFPEKAVINSVRYEVRNVQVSPWKDTHVITSLETIKTVTATDGTTAGERTTHTLTHWNLEPDFSDSASFRPRLPLPDGSRVLVQDAPSLEYVYKDGRIGLAVHKKTVESLERVQTSHRPGPPRVQWIWAAVSAVLAVAWWRLRASAS